ncbi:MAG: general secretion pathway protein M [Halieaceae bacterium]|jgi:general secretion pathway protein M
MLLWFQQLRHREQLIVFAGCVALLGMFLYTAILAPLSRNTESLQRQNIASAKALESVESMVARIEALRRSGASEASGSGGANLARLINTHAARFNLKISRMQPNSKQEMQVRFEEAVFGDLLSWLYQLEIADGLIVKEVAITQTGGVGLVTATIRLAGK